MTLALTNRLFTSSMTTLPTALSYHPLYAKNFNDWFKWRLTYEGGNDFINQYLKKLSDRESDTELEARRCIAYVPAFAAAAIDDIKNAIFQRTADVDRIGGAATYARAITGLDGGVDLESSTMGTFIGLKVLDELLFMSKVGILVDAPDDVGDTLYDKQGKIPYLCRYQAEDIINWAPRVPVNGFDILLLREWYDDVDEYGLPSTCTFRYRLYRREKGYVSVTFLNQDGSEESSMTLNVPRIPFTVFETPRSLMKNVADYQIALLNLESSDISFARKANFPFFYEFYDQKTEAPFNKPVPGPDGVTVNQNREKEIEVGLTKGRRYPTTVNNAPGFINPDPDTLRVSMEKGDKLKEDIRLLVNLNLLNMNPRRQSQESKAADAHSLEASLSFIGLTLQKGEQQIAEHWNMFEGYKGDVKITYPKSYSLKTEDERQAEAEKLSDLQDTIPSLTFKKVIAKKIVKLTVPESLEDELKKINKEIDASEALIADPRVILEANKAGLVDDETASNQLGYDGPTVVPQARKDRAEKIKLAMEAQGGPQGAGAARGAPEFGGQNGSQEKEGLPKRGEAL